MKTLARSAPVLQQADRTQRAIHAVLLHAESAQAVAWLEETFDAGWRTMQVGWPEALRTGYKLRWMVHDARPGWTPDDITINRMAEVIDNDWAAWSACARWPQPWEMYDLDEHALDHGPDMGQLLDSGALREAG